MTQIAVGSFVRHPIGFPYRNISETWPPRDIYYVFDKDEIGWHLCSLDDGEEFITLSLDDYYVPLDADTAA